MAYQIAPVESRNSQRLGQDAQDRWLSEEMIENRGNPACSCRRTPDSRSPQQLRRWLRRLMRLATLLLLLVLNSFSYPYLGNLRAEEIVQPPAQPQTGEIWCLDEYDPDCEEQSGSRGVVPREPSGVVAPSGTEEEAVGAFEDAALDGAGDQAPEVEAPDAVARLARPCGPMPVDDLPDRLVPEYWTWVAEVRVVNQRPWAIALFGLTAWAVALFLWIRYRGQRPAYARLTPRPEPGGSGETAEIGDNANRGMNGLLAMLLGICGVAGLTVLVIAGQRIAAPELAPDLQYSDPIFAQERFLHHTLNDPPEYAGLGGLRVVRGTPKLPVVLRLGSYARADISYRWQAQPNGEVIGRSRLWRAGYLAQPVRACDDGGPPDSIQGGEYISSAGPSAGGDDARPWFRRSLAVIVAGSEDRSAQRLAARLLDLGGVDAVLVGTDALEQADNAFGERMVHLTVRDQLLVILMRTFREGTDGEDGQIPYRLASAVAEIEDRFPGRFAAVASLRLPSLREALQFDGGLPLADAWQGLYSLVAGDERSLLLRGGPRTRKEPLTGSELVQVCPGTFLMGSDAADPNARPDEMPALPVMVDGFWIAAHETTNAQYRDAFLYQPKEDADPLAPMPKLAATFDEALAFCRQLSDSPQDGGGRLVFGLPTEAQWEYAARAGSTRTWFGTDDPTALREQAWLATEESRQGTIAARPVTTKLPNALCLFDMHGNAAEMVVDCYASTMYQARGRDNPAISMEPVYAPADCRKRVVRGGAHYSDAVYARSAARSYDYPWSRDVGRGFRCIATEDLDPKKGF